MRLPIAMAGTALLAGLTLCLPGACKDDHDHGTSAAAHGHTHPAPHDGTLVVLGNGLANLEFLLDQDIGRLTVWVYDGHVDHSKRITQPTIDLRVKTTDKDFTVSLRAVENPLTGEKPGDAAEFQGQSDELKGMQKFTGTVKAISVLGSDLTDVTFEFPEGDNDVVHDH